MAKKHTYEYIKKCFESRGYVLLSTEYKNSKVKLEYRCPEGHIGNMTYSNFKKGQGCYTCSVNSKKKSFEDVKHCFEACGYILLSTKYVNSVTKLKFVCPKGHVGLVTYNGFQQGCRCQRCAIDARRKVSFEDIRKAFSGRGYALLSTEYKNVLTKLTYSCPAGHIGNMSYYNFQKGHGCPYCAGNSTLEFEYVKNYFKGQGYELLSTKYEGSHSKLMYKCPLGHICSVTYTNFQQGKMCPICSSGPVSKISQYWLDSLNIQTLEREHSFHINKRLYKVDAYDLGTNIIYEFLGNYWHGNPEMYNPNDINPTNKKSYGQLYKETFERLTVLEEAGYKVVYIWESDFIALNK
jgi:hypothetical protein